MLFKNNHNHPKIRAIGQRITHCGVVTAHLGYCGAVFIESHGTYGLMAGILGVFILLGTLFGGSGE